MIFTPPEFCPPAHLRAGGDGEVPSLDIAVEHSGRQQLDPHSALDVALDLTCDGDRFGTNAARELRALLDREVAFDVDVALEPSSDANVTGANDFAGDGELGGDDRLFQF